MTDRQGAVEKARKLLRLKERAGSEFEAIAAARALAALLDKHRIAIAELEASGQRLPEPFAADPDRPLYAFIRSRPWRRELCFALGDHFGVALWRRTRIWKGGDREHGICMCGRPSDIELLRDMYEWLCSEIVSLSAEQCAGRGPAYANSWRRGFVHGVHKQLASLRDATRECSCVAIELYGRLDKAREYLEALCEGHVRKRSDSPMNYPAYREGFARGALHHLGPRFGPEPEPPNAIAEGPSEDAAGG
jgi:hypothetical protein